MTFRSRKLLNLAHEIPCRAQFPHLCNGPSVPAHSNALEHGRGGFHKSHDCFHAAVCPEAHDFLDGRKGAWDEETKRAEWNRAYIATQVWYWMNELVLVAK